MGDIDNSHGDHGIQKARTQNGRNEDGQKDRRKGQHNVHESHDGLINPFSVKTGEKAQDRPRNQRNGDCNQADDDRDPASVNHAAQDIPAQTVRAERMGC